MRGVFSRRVVVTGLGAVTPIGTDMATFWGGLIEGRSGAGPITAFDVTGCRPSYAAEVKGFAADAAGVPKKRLKMMGRQAQLAFAAVGQAWADAGLAAAGLAPPRIGLILGVGMLNADVTELGRAFHATARAAGPGTEFDEVTFCRAGGPELFPLWLLRHIPNLSVAHASIALDAQGPSNTIATGCVAAANAVGEAVRIVGRGEADVVLAGGTDARVSPLATLRYRDLGWLSTRDDVAPEAVSAPFDQDATGFVSGEGSGVLAIESLEHARNRRAGIYAEVLGYAAANDGADLLSPTHDGSALARATCRCLERSGVKPEEIDVVFAPAPAVPALDRATAAALTKVFGAGCRDTAITATRSLLGHAHAASAALDCLAAIKAINDSRIPATANLHRPIADLPFVTGAARRATVRKALVAAYGFGGHAASLALSRYEA